MDFPCYEKTHTHSPGKAREYTPDDPQPFTLDVKVGTLHIRLDESGYGPVILDGVPLKCRAATIQIDAGESPQISLEIYP